MTVTADLMDTIGTAPPFMTMAIRRCCSSSTAPPKYWRGRDALREADLLGVLDIVPASRTVLIKLAGPRYQAPDPAAARQAAA